jgi:hypothetical protein
MKRFATVTGLMAALPASAFAHGAHMPVSEAQHGLAHLAPALAVIALAGVVLYVTRRKGNG